MIYRIKVLMKLCADEYHILCKQYFTILKPHALKLTTPILVTTPTSWLDQLKICGYAYAL